MPPAPSHKIAMDSMLKSLSYGQQDLERLSCEPSNIPFELNGGNNYYGNGNHLRTYASLPEKEPLPFVMEHFVPLDYTTPHDYELSSGLPTFLTTHKTRAHVYRKLGIQKSVVAGSGIHYAIKVMEQNQKWQKPKGKKGTIAFPHKSSRFKDRSFNFEAFADWLVALPEKFHPICVCIYWKDYLKGRHQAYLERGIPVLSCGHILDPDFLFRFIDISTRFKYSCSNGIGSSYPFSVLCGCHYFYKDFDGVTEKEIDHSVQHLATPGAESDLGSKLKELAPYPPSPKLFKKQQNLVNFVTGKKQILSQNKIRKIFNWSHKRLLKLQPSTFSCLHPAKLAELNVWLPKHIYPDGWSGSDTRIILKPSRHFRTLTMFLELPSWLYENTRPLNVIVEGSCTEYACPPGYHKLIIPLHTNAEASVQIKLPAQKKISDTDSRSVSFRFLGWEVTNEVTPLPLCTSMKYEALPSFILDNDSQ